MNKSILKKLPALLAILVVIGGVQTFTSCSSDDRDSGGYTGSYGSIEYGGKTYKTVKIGTQTWFAENLNYDPGIGNSACYDNDPKKCDIYGRLYDWSTAMGLSSSCNENNCSDQIQSNHQGICPSGYHISSEANWDVLMTDVGGGSVEGKKLKTMSGWNNNGNGTDEYGFSALPGGGGLSDGNFNQIGDSGNWWSTSEYNSDEAFDRHMSYIYERVYWGTNSKSYLLSVRCVQN